MLFRSGEKYGATVRVVEIPMRSQELCGGTHVRNTGQILMFRITSETGVSAGVRRIVAITGAKAFEAGRERERALDRIADQLKVNTHAAGLDALTRKVEQLLGERKAMEKKLEEALKGGGGGLQKLLADATPAGAWQVVAGRTDASAVADLQAMGDTVREQLPAGAGVLGGVFEDGKATLVFVIGDALREKGISAGDLVKAFAAKTGGRGGGKPHMAQMGVEPAKMDEVLMMAREFVIGVVAAKV